jgi:uncharacterized protein (DUF1697 family)
MGRRYVALLRGINVGGRNKVAMADLRHVFEEAGHEAVRTYIQSGNVLFESDRASGELAEHLEGELERRLGMSLVVVVRSDRQMRNVVDKAPSGFGRSPDEYHSDVIFLKQGLTTARAMEVVQLRDGVDQVWTGTNVLYFARLSAERTRSKLNKIVGTDAYRAMTIRSWATTTKLVAMLDD